MYEKYFITKSSANFPDNDIATHVSLLMNRPTILQSLSITFIRLGREPERTPQNCRYYSTGIVQSTANPRTLA